MAADHLAQLLEMRILIGFLGERSQFAWWPTAFYEASSRLFLEPVFSKTSRLAQYHGVLEAARRLHDEHLSVGTYHLFRLPEEMEQDLHSILQSGRYDGLQNSLSESKQAALTALNALAGKGATFSEGPVALGRIQELDQPETLQAFSGAYLTAFLRNARSFPYLLR